MITFSLFLYIFARRVLEITYFHSVIQNII